MHLMARVPRADDFPQCYRVCYATFGYPEEPGNNVAQELRFLWSHPATLSLAFEDEDRPPGRQMVGYLDAVFVTDAFVRWADADMPPYVNRNLLAPLPDGSAALMDRAAIAAAQAGAGLNLLVTHWGWDGCLGPEDGPRVRDRMSREFFQTIGGYHVKEIMVEVIGRDLCHLALTLGYRLRRSYGGPPEDPPASLPDLCPFLMGVSRAEALAREGTWVSHAFVYTPPRFFFTRVQQDLLAWVLREGSEEGYAEANDIGDSALKKRWDKIFAVVEDTMPNLLPHSEGDTRGREKRRRLLQYLRGHPAELRPHQRPRPKRAVKNGERERSLRQR